MKRAVLVSCLVLTLALVERIAAGGPSEDDRKGLVEAMPETLGLDGARLNRIEAAMVQSIGAGEIPGGVVLVARHGKIAYLKAFGNRSLQPAVEAMTPDTIFDVSSLTKVVATAPAIMLLVEDGIVRLDDKVRRYLPEFKGDGKENITVRQLLTHYSGLAADFDLSKPWSGYAAALEELWKTETESEPGNSFVYSDLNFIVLGEIVRAVSGQTLDQFVRDRVFLPLGMTETFFLPSSQLVRRIAPTEPRRNTLQYLGGAAREGLDAMVRGEVHDPTAWKMGGVAGHAGLFSTARDLAIYARMLLDRGAYARGRFMSPLAVDAMTAVQSPPNSSQIRGFGWDIQSDYSSPRGDLFRSGYGHTGFTGASLWVHPPTDTLVIVLSNRVHPKGGKDINHLRAVIANVVASSILDPNN